MNRRILASFLAVLVAMIVFVEVPLGLQLARHERTDFHQTTVATARSLAAAAEERLGDAGDAGRGFTLSVGPGDGVVVLDRTGRVVGRSGAAISQDEIQLALRRSSVSVRDRTIVVARVGEDGAADGTVLFARSSEGLDHRLHGLEVALVVAALGAIALGALVAVALARWVARPLRSLQSAAAAMGTGDLAARADHSAGPPEVRELATEFNVMAERLGTLVESQRVMTMDVSHQLRTPLAALRLRLENLAAESPEPLQGDVVDSLGELARLSRLADGLLAVARAEEVDEPAVPVDVATAIADRCDLWQPVADERAVGLAAQVIDATAMSTEGHIEQILDNLISNALDVVPAGGGVTVTVSTDADSVVVAVVDDGPGLPPEIREHAFERFSGGGRRGSTGLGLAIVSRLVHADHGTVGLSETPGGGLTVSVRLPRARG